jgi:predicted aspartyl protease
MGRIIEKINVVNQTDEILARQGIIASDQIHSIETEVLVDTSTKFLGLRKSLIEKLQLEPVRRQSRQTSRGAVARTIYSSVTVYLRDRFAVIDVAEISDDSPNVLGRIPLWAMDWVIDPKNERLIGNPEHGGEWMLEEY